MASDFWAMSSKVNSRQILASVVNTENLNKLIIITIKHDTPFRDNTFSGTAI